MCTYGWLPQAQRRGAQKVNLHCCLLLACTACTWSWTVYGTQCRGLNYSGGMSTTLCPRPQPECSTPWSLQFTGIPKICHTSDIQIKIDLRFLYIQPAASGNTLHSQIATLPLLRWTCFFSSTQASEPIKVRLITRPAHFCHPASFSIQL